MSSIAEMSIANSILVGDWAAELAIIASNVLFIYMVRRTGFFPGLVDF